MRGNETNQNKLYFFAVFGSCMETDDRRVLKRVEVVGEGRGVDEGGCAKERRRKRRRGLEIFLLLMLLLLFGFILFSFHSVVFTNPIIKSINPIDRFVRSLGDPILGSDYHVPLSLSSHPSVPTYD